MPEIIVVLVFVAWILEAMKEMERKFGTNEWALTIFSSAFSVGTAQKPHTTMWKWEIDELCNERATTFSCRTDEEFYADAKLHTDLGTPPLLQELKSKNQIPDWDDLRAMPGRKYKETYNDKNGAPWREDVGVRNSVTGPLSVGSRGHELAICTGNSLLRINLGLEAQIVVVRTRDWDMMLKNGTIPGNQPPAWKAELMRSFTLPTHLQNPLSHEGLDASRHIVVFAAWRFCHDDGVTILLVDHSRLLNLSLLKFTSGFRQEFWDYGHPAYSKLWSANHGPDFISQQTAWGKVLKLWRQKICAIPNTKGSQVRRCKPIAQAIYESTEVFNGFGAHTANDLVAMMGIHPCMPVYEVCAQPSLWNMLLEALDMCRTKWCVDSPEFQELSRPRSYDNPFSFNLAGDTLYVNHFVYVASKTKAIIPKSAWRTLADNGLLDEDHLIGQPYTKMLTYTKDELSCQKKWVDIVRVKATTKGKRYWYTPVLAQAPSHWTLASVEWAIDDDGNRVWKDLRACGRQTTLGPDSFRDQKRNEWDMKKLSKGGRRATLHTGQPGKPAKNKPLVKTLKKKAEAGSVRSIRPKVGAVRCPLEPLEPN